MNILLPENKSFNTARIPDVDNDLYFSIINFSDLDDIDYHFIPVVFIEEFPKAGFELKIGEYRITVPFHWSILIGDPDVGDLEVIPLKKFMGREFSAFTYNPCKGFRPKFLPIEFCNLYQEIKWSIPSIKPSYLLSVPLRDGDNPLCAFFAEEKHKLPDVIDIKHLF